MVSIDLPTQIETLSEEQYAYALLTPALLFVTVVAFWPILWTAWLSLHTGTGGLVFQEFVGLDNYIGIFTGDILIDHPFFDVSSPFESVILVTLIFTFGAVILTMAIGFVQALILNKSFRGRGVLRVLILLPWAVPIAIQGMIFNLMFTGGVGVGTEWLSTLGIENADVPLVYSRESMLIIILAEIWKQSAFVAIIVLAGLQSIDRSLYQVGDVSGASRWQKFRTITFPLVLPALFIALLFRTIESLRVYGLIESVSSCSDVPSLACVVVEEFQIANYAISATLAMVLAVLVAAVVSVYLVNFANINIGGK